MNKHTSGSEFLNHVPVHPRGTDPSRNDLLFNQPAPIRETSTHVWIRRGNGSVRPVGRLNGGDIVQPTATIAVTLANITVGDHILYIGPYVLRPFVDFAAAASDIVTAGNLAAAISSLHGYSATNVGTGTVTVTRLIGTTDETEFRVVESGAASGFAFSAPEDVMEAGTPSPGPPLLS